MTALKRFPGLAAFLACENMSKTNKVIERTRRTVDPDPVKAPAARRLQQVGGAVTDEGESTRRRLRHFAVSEVRLRCWKQVRTPGSRRRLLVLLCIGTEKHHFLIDFHPNFQQEH